MQAVFAEVMLAADSDSTVLLRGETGTGKTEIARAIHSLSRRHKAPFREVNCSAIPETLLESELFGYERGAFTDAKNPKAGLIETTHGGTLFLDEIGDMPTSTQKKLLSFIQNRTVQRLGSTEQPKFVDVRLIAATHQPLEELIAAKTFREDLFYRINVIPITVPPLRDRLEALEPLVNAILKRISERHKLKTVTVTRDALRLLANHDWPGNVRELENVLERAVNRVENGKLTAASFPATADLPRQSLKDHLRDAGRKYIAETLSVCDGDKPTAARKLGVGLNTLYRYLAPQ
jgi:two-component system NtrC family response regulator